MENEVSSFDPTQFLGNPEARVELLLNALESGNAQNIASALGTIARARGMTQVARASGVNRVALYRALSSEGDPKLSTFLAVLKALGLRLSLGRT